MVSEQCKLHSAWLCSKADNIDILLNDSHELCEDHDLFSAAEDDAAQVGGGVAGGVGVLDAEDERAAGVLGVRPVEQRGANHADVRGSGG